MRPWDDGRGWVMLETSRSGSRCYCPECGTLLRAPRADAGSVIPCLRCGEQIRVPRGSHPLESDIDDTPLIPLPAARSAAIGLRHLITSLWLWLIGFVVALLVLAVWAIAEGPAAVLNRQAGEWTSFVATGYGIRLGLLAAAAWLRWIGYGRCEAAAVAVRAGGWVTSARLGVVFSLLGYAMAAYPDLAALSAPEVPLTLRAVAHLGDFARIAGVVLEMGAILVWARLLSEAAGPLAARRVSRYAITVLAATALLAVGFCGTGMITAIALGMTGPRPAAPSVPNPRIDFTQLPTEGWLAIGSLVLLGIAVSIVLFVQYLRILRAAQDTLSRYPLAGDSVR